ncbi:HSF-type DNA-binding protein [Nitzschia inconspicua]|uniref:HSF-type DNA-binding protein n=1 Tax=Nitzschia inconspicua TaxID=303405 RepID=A0A9K3PQF7_9STRA|nr:HSF-type DNA-binding protein [Nitzschia inconspicua]
MCLGIHQPIPKPIALGHKAIEESLILNTSALNNVKQNQDGQSPEKTSHLSEKQRNRRIRQPHPHIVVEHHYHDHSHDPYQQYQDEQHPARGGVTVPFPMKLHAMLEGVRQEGLEDVCSWQPHGRSFVVRNPKEFVALLPKYFKLTKLASFQRQLNLYGFQRLTRGKERGAYYHEMFLRGKPYLAHHIERMKVKGTGVRARSNPAQEPDFWSMEWMEESDNAGATTPPLQPPHFPQQNVSAPWNKEDTLSSPFVYPGSVPVLPPSVSSAPCIPIVSPSSNGRTKVSPKVSANNTFVMCDDDVVSAFDKNFHYMDPFQPLPLEDLKYNTVQSVNEQDASTVAEAEQFFQGFEFPNFLFDSQVENDAIFGEMLESLIA